MNLLQVILIVSGFIVFIIGYDFFKRNRLNIFQIFLLIFVSISIIIFTLFPSILNKFGAILGLQRGADALVYISILFLGYIVISLYNKILDNRKDITELTREISIENSKKKELFGKEVFVIPCYNEGEVIGETIENILENGYKNILVVNDGSKDNSRKILESFKDKIVLLNHLKNRGQGAALETGFEYIRRYGNVDYIITFDSDGQHDLNDLGKFYKVLDNSNDIDIVLGTRFSEKSNTNVSLSRKIILKLGVIFTLFISNIKLTDSHNGYRVFRKRILNDLKITIDGMGHASEIVDIVAKKKLKFAEVPVNIKYTEYSLSKGQKSSNAINIAFRMIYEKFFK